MTTDAAIALPAPPPTGSGSRATVSVRGLVQRFGSVEAVRGVSFDLEPGQVVGFIGQNGAGKTTTMRMLVTLDVPVEGSVLVCGYDALSEPSAVRRRIGWMPDSYGTYRHVTIWEYLDFFARAYGFAARERRARIEEVVEFADLAALRERDTSRLSKGESQRLCLARALLHDPDVLVLDEPAAGLDPKARVEFKRLVHLLARAGKTLFISSHILSELEEMCDRLLFLDEGRIVHAGSAESLRRGATTGVVVCVHALDDSSALRAWAELQAGVDVLDDVRGGVRLRLAQDGPEALATTLRRMLQAGLRVCEFRVEERRLEDAFVDVLRQIDEEAP